MLEKVPRHFTKPTKFKKIKENPKHIASTGLSKHLKGYKCMYCGITSKYKKNHLGTTFWIQHSKHKKLNFSFYILLI